MDGQLDDALTQAIERNAAAVLALPSAGMTRYHKTRFLRAVDDRVWLESVTEDQPLIQNLVQTGVPVEVTFKINQRRANFVSPIVELDGAYRFFDTQETIQAVVMRRPASLKPVQRRTNYRVALRPEDGFRIQLWRINDHVSIEHEPQDLCELKAVPHDLSAGGVGVSFQKKPLLIAGQRLRVLLSWGDRVPMLLEGRSSQVWHDRNTDTCRTGIQFQYLQLTIEGRQFLTELTRTVSSLQLEEAKRNKR